jgi:hypothetical protein
VLQLLLLVVVHHGYLTIGTCGSGYNGGGGGVREALFLSLLAGFTRSTLGFLVLGLGCSDGLAICTKGGDLGSDVTEDGGDGFGLHVPFFAFYDVFGGDTAF